MEVLLPAALVAGILTVASPCVLMVLPILLSTSGGGGRLRPLGIVLAFVLSFTAFTLAFAGALQALAVPATWLRAFTIVALGLFGLALLIPAWGRAIERALAPLARAASSPDGGQRNGFGGGLLIGAGLGLLWAPCAGPLMALAISLTATAGFTAEGVAIALAYTLGAGIPMLLIAYGTRGFVARAKGMGRNTAIIQRIFGGLTVAACVALFMGVDVQIQSWVQTGLPQGYSSFLTAPETGSDVQREIDELQDRVLPAETEPTPLAAAQVIPTLEPTPVPEPTSIPQPTTPPASPTPKPIVELKDQGPAPELTGITGWINSEPLTLESLRGKVVIIDFWTFGCYNCRNTRPHVRTLYDKYRDQGLEIVGVHTPEFAYEKVYSNVKNAARDQRVNWPIALDPEFKTWRAFNNRYWPAFYFIDATGRIRHKHFGEGGYEFNDKVVQQLLMEAKASALK
jgi:cytochrome c biogenesis protein CcdA/thiol-disulfide isomerase/thioredoxin